MGITQTQSTGPQEQRYWKFRVFFFMWFGYVLYYFSRQTFAFAKPALSDSLGYDAAELGIVVSVMTFCYGLSKFTGGILADKLSPRILVGLGLILTGIVNLCFGFTASLVAFAFFWGLNGWCQGLGAVPCAKLMIHWYPQEERGRWWSFWNTAHNVGAISIALIVGYLTTHFAWHYAFWIPGSICIVGGVMAIFGLRDDPVDVGLPALQEHEDPQKAAAREAEKKLSVKELLFEHVLNNRVLMVLAVANFLIYVVRWGFVEWTAFYLKQSSGCSNFKALGMFIPFELGGFLGNLTAGAVSDKIFGGRRGPINLLFTIGAAISAYFLWLTPATNTTMVVTYIGMIGFFIFGPQMMIGMAAAEAADREAAATSNGFVNLFAYMGATMAGYPLGKISMVYGWDGFFIAILSVAVCAALLLAPLWNLQSRAKQRQAQLVANEKKLRYA